MLLIQLMHGLYRKVGKYNKLKKKSYKCVISQVRQKFANMLVHNLQSFLSTLFGQSGLILNTSSCDQLFSRNM